MVFANGKDMIITILNEFLKKQDKALEAVEKSFKNLEENEKQDLENKISESEALINSNLKEIEALKEETKKYEYKKQEKKGKLDEKQKLVNDLKNKIKEYSKNLSKLPANTKNKISEFRGLLKEFYKLTTGFLKITTSQIDLEKLIKVSDDHLNYIIRINNEIPLDEFIRESKLDFKIKHPKKSLKITDYNQYVTIFLESILYHILEQLDKKVILKDKENLSELALSYAKGISKYAEFSETMEINYYKDLVNYCECEFISVIAHKEFDKFKLTKATSYFLDAKNRLNSLSNLDKELNALILEKIKIMEAWASDAYNLIYLFNSYNNWVEISNSENPELKEIAQITKDKVEDFITSQFGFPEESQIKDIIKEIKWPSPSTPPVIEKIGPRH